MNSYIHILIQTLSSLMPEGSNKNRDNGIANTIEAFENMENIFRLINFLEDSKLVQN